MKTTPLDDFYEWIKEMGEETDLLAKFGEIFRPEQELEYTDEINY